MAQACTVLHAEKKRSLPAWMLKSSSAKEAPKVEDQNKQALESNVKIGVVGVGPTNPTKRKVGRRLKNVDSEGASQPVALQRCEGREKATRKSKDSVQDEVEQIIDVTIKKGRKASEGAVTKNNRKRKLYNIKAEASPPISIDDDIELTVEDLVCIAEEYVNADTKKHCELEAVTTTGRKEHFSCPTIFTEADAGASVGNAAPMKKLFPCTTATKDTRSSEHIGDENKSHQELKYSSSCETTEDVARDMLNLFFGPLWNKPAGCAKKSDPIELTRTTNNHVPEGTDWHSEVPAQGEPVKKSMPVVSMTATTNHVPDKKDWRSELPKLGEHVTKKKSSLRDKVALLL
ncbi:hypothetical protein HU200_022275 [Digitaria exilis]|uniref:Uncharacterized protein n=1 Tax=Digitaria exilis TaxID=1010633 RepID=A0A835EYQ9_9POAL|nr:hypothetical protein HU200_022275 [Digitaria exilis]